MKKYEDEDDILNALEELGVLAQMKKTH